MAFARPTVDDSPGARSTARGLRLPRWTGDQPSRTDGTDGTEPFGGLPGSWRPGGFLRRSTVARVRSAVGLPVAPRIARIATPGPTSQTATTLREPFTARTTGSPVAGVGQGPPSRPASRTRPRHPQPRNCANRAVPADRIRRTLRCRDRSGRRGTPLDFPEPEHVDRTDAPDGCGHHTTGDGHPDVGWWAVVAGGPIRHPGPKRDSVNDESLGAATGSDPIGGSGAPLVDTPSGGPAGAAAAVSAPVDQGPHPITAGQITAGPITAGEVAGAPQSPAAGLAWSVPNVGGLPHVGPDADGPMSRGGVSAALGSAPGFVGIASGSDGLVPGSLIRRVVGGPVGSGVEPTPGTLGISRVGALISLTDAPGRGRAAGRDQLGRRRQPRPGGRHPPDMGGASNGSACRATCRPEPPTGGGPLRSSRPARGCVRPPGFR